MEQFAVLIELQKYGLTQSEILSVPEEEREELLKAIEECEEREVSYLNVIKTYVKDYVKYKSFEEFLRPSKFV